MKSRMKHEEVMTKTYTEEVKSVFTHEAQLVKECPDLVFVRSSAETETDYSCKNKGFGGDAHHTGSKEKGEAVVCGFVEKEEFFHARNFLSYMVNHPLSGERNTTVIALSTEELEQLKETVLSSSDEAKKYLDNLHKSHRAEEYPPKEGTILCRWCPEDRLLTSLDGEYSLLQKPELQNNKELEERD